MRVLGVSATLCCLAALLWLLVAHLRDRRALAGQAAARDSQLLTILDGMPIAVMLRAADGSLLHANPACERFLERLGIDTSYIHASPSSMLEHIEVVDEQLRPCVPAELPVVAALRESASREATLGYTLPAGDRAWYATRAAPVSLSNGTVGTVVTCDDVTDRRSLEEQLRDAALTDPLTGLANRRALGARLLDAQQRRARTGGDVGLLFVDLDRFKAVNDTYGHEAGDRVLDETGKRLVEATRDVDLVCRLGGDEFVVLCAPVDGQQGLDHIAERIRALSPLVVELDGEAVSIVGSIGAILLEPEEELDAGLGRADTAMYRAKRGQRAVRSARR